MWPRPTNHWQWMRDGLRALKPCRVPFILVLLGLVFLFTAQGADVLRALAEHRTAHSSAKSQTIWFFGAAFSWALCAWYWARTMNRLALPNVPPDVPEFRFIRLWSPRLLG